MHRVSKTLSIEISCEIAPCEKGSPGGAGRGGGAPAVRVVLGGSLQGAVAHRGRGTWRCMSLAHMALRRRESAGGRETKGVGQKERQTEKETKKRDVIHLYVSFAKNPYSSVMSPLMEFIVGIKKTT
ncbi:hypothetical protein CEXT_580911 [Caerostris extrusa]|uniref:Uncharacterized protein n=1 Tax=Caerostris extrusa TaxID=172846 RepID=A0AAV4V2U9_CAEEX|nr:hypothetical protein CEXT_580911 [Caerostris extrusa]